MDSQTLQVTWRYATRIWLHADWWHRYCRDCHRIGLVANAPDAERFISQPDWVCAGCRKVRESSRTAPIRCFRIERQVVVVMPPAIV